MTNQASIPSTAPTIVRVAPSSGGFDWADAGIGAGGAFALSMIALGGAAVVSQRRGRHAHDTAQTS